MKAPNMQILGWSILILSFGALLHSYVLYPFIMRLLARKKQLNDSVHLLEDIDLPFVSIISSLYNEEAVIAEKLDSLFNLQYPDNKINFYFGSDCSSDCTNTIIEERTRDRSNFYFFPFRDRRGKPPVINDLVERARRNFQAQEDHILIITDANVMLSPDTVFLLVRHFKNPNISLVDAHMKHIGMRAKGISQAENQYISSEVMLKHWEGVAWQTMMGPFGGCYAIRAELYTPVPPNSLVDDFYIAMKVFEQGGRAINELKAICYEAVSHEIKEEYRRKRRIASGNFQNMARFVKLWWPPSGKIGFSFFSHKILRWLGPFFLIGMIIGVLLLSLNENLFAILMLGLLGIGFILFPIVDILLSKLKINILPLRGIRYFILMNVALLEGFFKYLKGIKSNVWQPPKRN